MYQIKKSIPSSLKYIPIVFSYLHMGDFFLPVAISGPTKITILLFIYWCAILSRQKYPSKHWIFQLKWIINLSEVLLQLENSFWIIVDSNKPRLEHFQFFQLCLFLFCAFDYCGTFQRHDCHSMANGSLKAQEVFTKLPERNIQVSRFTIHVQDLSQLNGWNYELLFKTRDWLYYLLKHVWLFS